jgi:hypothetical protein
VLTIAGATVLAVSLIPGWFGRTFSGGLAGDPGIAPQSLSIWDTAPWKGVALAVLALAGAVTGMVLLRGRRPRALGIALLVSGIMSGGVVTAVALADLGVRPTIEGVPPGRCADCIIQTTVPGLGLLLAAAGAAALGAGGLIAVLVSRRGVVEA